MPKINMSEAFSGNFARTLGIMAVGYLVWKNRYRFQELLESNGVKTPWIKENVGGAIRSGVAKLKGSAKYDMNRTNGAAI